MPFDRFFLGDSHPMMLEQLEYLTRARMLAETKQMSTTGKKTTASSADKEDAKWLSQHFTSVQKASVLNPKRWAGNRWDDPVFCATHPWFSLLHDRERYCLMNAEFEAHGVDINVDLSQAAERKPFREIDEMTNEDGIEMVNCVTPEGNIWNTRRCRLLVGREKLAVHTNNKA